jgi:hypothetical protein
VQVGAVEAAHHLAGVLHREALHDLGSHRWRRGRREGEHPQVGELPAHVRDAQVVRPEVVAPARDAVGLVDHQQRGRELGQPPHDVLVGQLLRCEEQELRGAGLHPLPRLGVLRGRLR